MRILVLNSHREGHSHKYYAIMSKGFPHTLPVGADGDLSSEGAAGLDACIKIDLALEGEKILATRSSDDRNIPQNIPLYFRLARCSWCDP
jgi:hypothetical protein